MAAIVQSLQADQARIAGIYAERSGLQKQNASALFDQQKTYSATEAKTFSFVDQVQPLTIEPGARVVHLNIS